MAEAGLVEVGSDTAISFRIAWESLDDASTADEATRGELIVVVDGAQVWIDRSGTPPRGIRWSMIELLEHLAFAWPYIENEECDPMRLCVRPDKLRGEAERLWESQPAEQRLQEQRELLAFEDTHDLARAFQGLWVPSIRLLRQGKLCWLVSPTSSMMMPIEVILSTLSDLGDRIVERLSGMDDERSRDAVRAWSERRSSTTPDSRLEIALGLSSEQTMEIVDGADPSVFFEFSPVQNGSELVAVARMTGTSMASADIRELLGRVRTLGKSPRTLLDEWSDMAESELRNLETDVPFDQGNALARWLRRQILDMRDSQRVDPDVVLRTLNIEAVDIELPTASLDAVCVWSPERGPVVLVNTNGRHGTGRGRRATLAHEICHLLLDRRGALPLAEVKGGAIDSGIEARARAFAAELLVPGDMAGQAFCEGDPVSTLRSLTSKYGASSELVAWQARNSSVALPSQAHAFLRGKVSRPARF